MFERVEFVIHSLPILSPCCLPALTPDRMFKSAVKRSTIYSVPISTVNAEGSIVFFSSAFCFTPLTLEGLHITAE